MGWRAAALALALSSSYLLHGRSPDMILAHSPPRHIHDEEDLAHQGFSAFNLLIKWFKPRYFLHGHTMNYRQNIDMPQNTLGETKIVNISPYRVLEVELHA
jgi:Icc-related predicted phosphoesterase